MNFSTRIIKGARYFTFGQFIFNENMIGLLDGTYVVGSVPRASVTAVRFERRPSFKHPIPGLLLALFLTAVPLDMLTGNHIGIGKLAFSSCSGIFFSLLFGIYLIVQIIRRHQEEWIVFILGSTERAFPLKKSMSQEELDALNQLCNRATVQTLDPICAVCGYNLIATPDRCPECGTEVQKQP